MSDRRELAERAKLSLALAGRGNWTKHSLILNEAVDALLAAEEELRLADALAARFEEMDSKSVYYRDFGRAKGPSRLPRRSRPPLPGRGRRDERPVT